MKRPMLAPLTPLYAAGVGLRAAGLRLGLGRVERLNWPVISVGSISAGGAGKTPFTIALAQLLVGQGLGVDVLSRGYGRLGTTVERVDPSGLAERFGDEPLLIARQAGVPVYVGAKRIEAGRLAEAAGEKVNTSGGKVRSVHLLDDGFQHRQLARDMDVVLVSEEDLRDWLLPAGNLRERLSALRRADVLAVPAGEDATQERLRCDDLQQAVWRYRRKMVTPASLSRTAGGKVVAFCGIARPGQFFAGLESAGFSVVGRHAFPDHHRLAATDFKKLRILVAKTGADALVTTEKDLVRLGKFAAELEVPVHAILLRVVLEDETAVMARLGEALQQIGL